MGFFTNSKLVWEFFFIVDADGIFLHVVKGHIYVKTATPVHILADEQLCYLPTLKSFHLHCEQGRVESRLSNEHLVKVA